MGRILFGDRRVTEIIVEDGYVDLRLSNKMEVKTAIEYLFNVKVISVNTSNPPTKHRRIGKFVGNRPHYKKAIITLASGNSINLFSEN